MATVTITPGWAGPLSGVGTAAIVVQVAGVGPPGAAGTAPSGTGIVTVTSGSLGTPGPLTGDVTTTGGGLATTLATVNSNVGSFTLASITVDAKGRVTAASSGSASGGTWGSITGTLSAQTDLQSALDAKAATAAANTFTVGGQVIQAAASVVGLSVDAASSPTTDAIRVRVGGTNYAALRQFPTPTGSTYASPVRLWMSSGTYSLSVGPDEGFQAFTLRNAADNGWANVVAGVVVAQNGLSATNYVLVGNVEISATAWRGDRVGLGSGTAIVWCSGTAGTGTADTGLRRNAAGVVEVTNGTAGTYRDLKLRNLTASAGIITLGTFTVATLPSASANAGALAQVTDSNSTTNGGTVAGGGANRVPVFSDGTNWIVK